MGVYGSRAVTLLVLISDDVINRILKLDMQTNILVYVTRCCTDLTSKVLKERTFGQSSAVLIVFFKQLHTKTMYVCMYVCMCVWGGGGKWVWSENTTITHRQREEEPQNTKSENIRKVLK